MDIQYFAFIFICRSAVFNFQKQFSRNKICMQIVKGFGTPRPKTILAQDSSARTFWPIFQSGTARLTLVGPLGSFFFLGGGMGAIHCFILFLCIKTRFKKLFNVILIFRQGNEPCHEKICPHNFRTPRSVQNTCEVLFDTGYPHDGRANKESYPQDGRADKDSYPHDRRADNSIDK